MLNTTKALRILFSNVAAQSGGRCEVRSLGDLARVCGLARGSSAVEWARAALRCVEKWNTRPTLKIGDIVVADYYDSIVIGRINGYDGSGYVHLSPVAPGSLMHSGRPNDDGLCLCPTQRKRSFKIGHKAYRSIQSLPASCVGGCYGSDRAPE